MRVLFFICGAKPEELVRLRCGSSGLAFPILSHLRKTPFRWEFTICHR